MELGMADAECRNKSSARFLQLARAVEKWGSHWEMEPSCSQLLGFAGPSSSLALWHSLGFKLDNGQRAGGDVGCSSPAPLGPQTRAGLGGHWDGAENGAPAEFKSEQGGRQHLGAEPLLLLTACEAGSLTASIRRDHS